MKKIPPLLLLLLGSLSLCAQTIYYVKPTGSDANGGRSWAAAFRTVQKALLTASAGEIWVAAGTYFPDEGGGQSNNNRDASFNLKNGVALYGGFRGTETTRDQRNWQTQVTILSGEIQQDADKTNNARTVVHGSSINQTAILDGFTIREGYADGEYGSGGGIYTYSAWPTITNCSFEKNVAGSGGAMFNMSGYPFVTNCRFWNNSAGEGGAIQNWDASPRLTNCSFWKNTAGEGAAIYNIGESTAFIANCSFSGNTANPNGGTIFNMSGGFANMSNSILWGNNTAIMNHWYRGYAAVSNSIVQGGYAGGTNILDVDPLFVDTAFGDLRLRACSPAINAGRPEFIPAGVTTDVRNRPRITLGAVDLGAYEFQPGEDQVIYVNASAPAGGDGTSWDHAFTHLQDALAKAGTCLGTTQVWVAAGTYYPDEGAGQSDNDRFASFYLKNNVDLYGGFAGTEHFLDERAWRTNETILSGDIDGLAGNSGNSYHVVQAAQVTTAARLDGFTITGGNADGTLFYLENCDIGGGLFLYDAAPTITNCSFRSNHAVTWGGAVGNMYTYGLVLTNCLFYDNSAKWGGAIAHYDYASSTVINCSFSGNTATGGGAIYSMNVSPQVTNSILWGNTGGQIESLHSPSVTYSIVQDGYYPGAGNLNADPLFVKADTGNLHLQACSPAIDAGNKEALSAATDLDGQPRTVVAQTDMGAYEFQGTVIYVKKEATGRANGTSWDNAYTSLQDALAQPTGCARLVTIWVAKGTYYPDEGAGQANNNRSLSFQLRNHTAILGGFAGTETSVFERSRDPLHLRVQTILSGEIDGVAGSAGNSYHVVQSSGVDATAVLDGFYILGGHANGSLQDSKGGGLLNTNGARATLEYLNFTGNAATNGGALANVDASPTLTNCSFKQNTATYGGAVYNSGASPVLNNGLFWKNTASSQGGALYNTSSSPVITNGSFNGNTAPSGGVLYNNSAAPVLTNSILWGNSSAIGNVNSTPVVTYSIVQGGYSGEGNLNVNPLFEDAATGDLRLHNAASPAYNAGNNAAVTVATALTGGPRILDGVVDMGAYEYGGAMAAGGFTLTCPGNFSVPSDADACGALVYFTGDHAATTRGGAAPVTLTYEPASGTRLPVGPTFVTVTATDAFGTTETCSFWVTVADSTAPQITGVLATPFVLYPPNHKLQEVKVKYTARDNCEVVSTALSVSSNEASNAIGSGNTATDWQVLNDSTVRLRAERSGKGTDRVYTITITAKDAAGNESQATTTVTVLHDQGAPVTVADAAGTKEVSRLQVSAVPNPSSEGFKLYTASPSTLPLSIRVLDAAGRVIETRAGVAPNGVLHLGNTYRPGVYYLQVQQGSVLQTLKLVKQTH